MYIMSDDGFNEYMADNLAQYDINQDIEQGFLFKKYQKKYYSENEHQLMQETSSNTWGVDFRSNDERRFDPGASGR